MQWINASPIESPRRLGAEVGFLVGLTFLVVGDPNTNLLAILK